MVPSFLLLLLATAPISQATKAQLKALEALMPPDSSAELTQTFSVRFDSTTERLLVPVHSISDPMRGCALLVVDLAAKTVLTLADPFSWACEDAVALAAPDLDGDGRLDVVLVRSYMTGIGPTGAQPFNVAQAWLNRGARFERDVGLERAALKKGAATVQAMKALAAKRFAAKP